MTDHAAKWADYEYSLIHEQINQLLDEMSHRPPDDLMKRPTISRRDYEPQLRTK